MNDRDGDPPPISGDDFAKSFGESIADALDLAKWNVGGDLSRDLDRIEAEVREAVVREDSVVDVLRKKLLPKLRTRAGAPATAGHYKVTRDDIEMIQKGLLFSGGVEACDGAICLHDTLALTIYQVGITLVSYAGTQGIWSQRLFRRDLKQSCDDPVEEALASLEHRQMRGAARTEEMGELIQKTLLGYAERAILLRKSKAVWRLGHGNPVPYELLTGGGNVELMEACLNTLRELLDGHKKFLFVAKEPTQRALLTVGQALAQWEFAVVTTLEDSLDRWLHQLRFSQGAERKLPWDGVPIPAPEWIPRFIRQIGPKVVVGVFRATRLAPPQVFYAHVDHAEVAGRIAIADAVFQEQRGAPMLLELAKHVGQAVFGDSLDSLAESAYSAIGEPGRKLSPPDRS